MSLIIAGGWVMVPLLLISIIVLALIIDRSLSYIWNPLPDADQQKNILCGSSQLLLKKFKKANLQQLKHISPKHLGSKIMLPRSVPVRRCLFTKAY